MWNNLPVQFLQNLCAGVPKRIDDIWKKKKHFSGSTIVNVFIVLLQIVQNVFVIFIFVSLYKIFILGRQLSQMDVQYVTQNSNQIVNCGISVSHSWCSLHNILSEPLRSTFGQFQFYPFVFAGTGGYQSSGKRDGGGGWEAKGTAERGGETDEFEPPTRCVSVGNFTCVIFRWTNLNFCPCSHVQLALSLCPLKKRWKQMQDQFTLETWVKGQILSDVTRGGGKCLIEDVA